MSAYDRIPSIPTSIDGHRVDPDQVAKAIKILDSIAGASITRVAWSSVKDAKLIAKPHKGKVVKVDTTATVGIDMEYKNQPELRGKETGERPWGTWVLYPILSFHKGQLYIRLYTVDGTVRSEYSIDGEKATREEYVAVMNPSALKGRSTAGTIEVKIQNLELLD